MTQPRMALPGTTYLITRSCAERRFFLRPDPHVNAAFAFCLARAQKLHPDIEVHAVSVQSNHFHAVVTDLKGGGELSDFMHALNTLMGRFLQAHLRDLAPGGTLERIWSRRSFNAVAQLTEKAVLKAIAYTLTNPVRHALVADYRKWPGFHTKPAHWAMPGRMAERPEVYFDQTDDSLQHLPLQLTPPPALRSGRTLQQVVRVVEDAVLSEQRRLVGQHQADNKRILGAKAVLATDPLAQPTTPRSPSALEPRLAAGGDHAAIRAGKKLLREFRAAYRRAWAAFQQGEILPFPFGTVLMRRRFHAPVDPPFQPPWCAAGVAT